MYVDRFETGGLERVGHLDMTVDALLAQDRNPRTCCADDRWRGVQAETQVLAQARIGRIGQRFEGLARAVGVVAQRRDLVAGLRPDALQFDAAGIEHDAATAAD